MEFSDIALAKFLQTAPELGPLILNFSEITQDLGEDGVKAGIFILRAGLGIVYIPVVAKGDTVFPVDSAFFETEAQFRPLTNATISQIVSSVSATAGKSKKIPDTVPTNPDVSAMINPPRTGKFVYASTSRLTEFLSILPEAVKQFTFEKIAAEQSLYSKLDKMFGLKAIFSVLNAQAQGKPINSGATGPVINRVNDVSVITSPRAVQSLGDAVMSAAFAQDGYVITGANPFSRIAVTYQPFNQSGKFTEVNPMSDGGRDFTIAFKNGQSKPAYLPKYHRLNPVGNRSIVSLFMDGTYARGNLVTNGDPLDTQKVLTDIFEVNPPKLLRDLARGEEFILFTSAGEALGPFTANSVTLTQSGVDIQVCAERIGKISGYRNYTKEVDVIGDTLFVPYNAIVVTLTQSVDSEVERSVNDALLGKELVASQYLGAELNLRHDGVEFSANGKTLGGFPSALKVLVEEEHLDPTDAGSFLKQAEEFKLLKVFLSKSAEAASTDFAPATIPQYGAVAPRVDKVAPNGALSNNFASNLQDAAGLNDSQVLEATVIAQLLQVPDLWEHIEEYLPELDMAVDKLGRTLFLTRVKLDQMSKGMDSESVFAIIAQIKNVYKMLGDCVSKLKTTVIMNKGYDPKTVSGQTNG